jgi:hypothetical protein
MWCFNGEIICFEILSGTISTDWSNQLSKQIVYMKILASRCGKTMILKCFKVQVMIMFQSNMHDKVYLFPNMHQIVCIIYTEKIKYKERRNVILVIKGK